MGAGRAICFAIAACLFIQAVKTPFNGDVILWSAVMALFVFFGLWRLKRS